MASCFTIHKFAERVEAAAVDGVERENDRGARQLYRLARQRAQLAVMDANNGHCTAASRSALKAARFLREARRAGRA